MSAPGSPIPRSWRASIPGSGSVSSLGNRARTGRGAGARMRGGGARHAMRGSRTPKARRVTTHSGVRVYGNSHRLSAGLCRAPATRSVARWWRRRATTCSATTGTRWRAIRQALETPQAIGRHAAERALRATGRAQAVDAHARRCCSRPSSRAGCSGISSARFAAPSQYRRASFLLDAAGKQVFPPFLQHPRAAAHAAGTREQPLRCRGRRHARSRSGERRGAAGLRARQLLGAQARTQDHRQRRRRAQSASSQSRRRAAASSRCSRAWIPGCS